MLLVTQEPETTEVCMQVYVTTLITMYAKDTLVTMCAMASPKEAVHQCLESHVHAEHSVVLQ
jgi:hypothetical protein